MSALVLDAAGVQAAPVEEVGGKGAGLARLVRLGCPVPDFVVLTTRAWSACGGSVEAPRAVTDEVRTAVESAVERLGGDRLAVRSSAVVEDGSAASWAGQFESFLAVGPAGVVDAVLGCWASAGTERARAYAELHQTAPGAMAVVIQRLVEGEASGVLFSRDPDDPERAVISAGLGLGEGVVQGQVPCDTYRVDEAGGIEARLDDKDEEVVLRDGAVVSRSVDGERRTRPALSEGSIRRLWELGRVLEEDLGLPVDVEFTVADGEVFLLQVRPVTVPVPRGRRLLWDNSNIVESYSGITTPLTFSFASRVYTIVYQLFCRVMGVDQAVIRANEPTFRRMIGLVRGRIYYNLNAWYRVLSLLPGFAFNKEAMETMMGVSEVASDEDAGTSGPRWAEGLKLAWLLGRLGWRLLTLERDAAAFQVQFDATLAAIRALDLQTMRPDQLLDAFEDAERELLWAWTPPLVNDFFCMIFYKLLHSQCQQLTGDEATQLHNELLGGHGELASAAPATELLGLARLALGNEALRDALLSTGSDEEALDEALSHEEFQVGFDRWMDRYGDRSPDELKLEAPTLRDTPGYVVGTIRAWIRRGELDGFASEDGASRRRAEAEVARLLRGVHRKILFGFVLRQARRRVAMRESLRFERTRVFAFVRNVFRAFGERYADAGTLDRPEDVFYLTVDEVLGYVRGTTASTDLGGLVALRRREFEGHHRAEPPAERFHTWGAVHLGNRFRGRPRPSVDLGADELVGTPCAPGRVTAAARVVHDPREVPDLGGDLLLAHRTDPGWVPLYPTASGILVERGSLLSHSAVVARELGIPAIVGLRGLLEWVSPGEDLEMDGATGRVARAEGEG